MRAAPVILAGTLALLAGCGEVRAVVPAPAPAPALAPAPVVPPLDLLGTWTDQAGGGFIAIGNRQIVVAVDGTARLVAVLVENAIEAGMSAGKLGLAGGTALFLARGSTLIQGLPVEHIDVEIVPPDGRPLRRRLLSEAGLRMASRLIAPAAPVAPPTRPPAADPDGIFLGAVPESLREAAGQQIARARAGGGAGELAAAFGNRQRLAFSAILSQLDQARNLPPELAAGRLVEADRERAAAESFARAWRAWMAGRG